MAKRVSVWIGVGLATLLLVLSAAVFRPAPPEIGAESRTRAVAAGSGSERYAMTVDPESLAIRVTDKLTGRVVLNSDNVLPDTETYNNGLNNTWEKFAASAVSIYYTNEKLYKSLLDFTGVQIELRETADGFSAKIKVSEIGLTFTLTAGLVGDTLKISIPFSSIKETRAGKSPLLSIVVYPFMNATRGLRTGDSFLLVPDGCGAIVDLTTQTLAKNFYSGRVYGDDLGVAGTTALKKYGGNPPQKVTFPVFGSADSGTGFVSRIVSGAEYSEIKAYASGITTDYNFVYNTFIYREGYFLPVDNKGTVVSRIQEESNVFDAAIEYTILSDEDASLSGMANAYRSELLHEGALGEKVSGEVPIKIDFLMADNYDDSFGRKVVKMTDANFVANALKEFKAAGLGPIVSGLSGYSKGGKRASSPRHFGFESKTGSKADYRALNAYAAEAGITVMPITDYIKGDNGDYIQWGGTHYASKDIAMSMGREFVSMKNYTFADSTYDNYRILHPQATARYAAKERDEIGALGFGGIQMNTMGNLLTSSAENYALTRTQAISEYRAIAESAGTLALEAPAEYLWRYTDYSVDTPVTGSNFMIALDSVPFLQMVTGGYIDSFRDYVNLRTDKKAALNMIEYNVYPAYILTENDPYNLFLTNSFYIFSSMYKDWKPKVIETYKTVAGALGAVRGAAYIGREAPAEDVRVCRYDNGVTIYINYGDSAYTIGDTTVGAMSYKVVRA